VANNVLSFLRGKGTAGPGRTLKVILSWDNDKLERAHDWVQWCFPTDVDSKVHPGGPMLTKRSIELASADVNVLNAVRSCFKRFLGFLGFELVHVSESRAKVRKIRGSDPNSFEARKRVCWIVNCADGNHNWKRISRALQCLRLLAMRVEVSAFYERLERLWLRGHLPRAALGAVEFWKSSAGFDHRLPPYGLLTLSVAGLRLQAEKILS